MNKFFYPLIILGLMLNIPSFAQTSSCSNNAAGELNVNSSCVYQAMNSTNNTDYWNGAGANGNCGESDFDDVWGWFTATSTSTIVTYDPTTSGFDPVITIFDQGPCSSTMSNNVACADGAGSNGTETVTFTTIIGNNYRVRIQDFGDNSSYDGSICVVEDLPPNSGTNDCAGGTSVCNSQSFSGNSSGEGVEELDATNSGCFSATGEHESSWYFFEASAAGNIEFTISPTSASDDYDWAVWGPYASGSTPNTICPPAQAPLRCSWAAGGGDTGLADGSGDNSEGSTGDQWVEDIVASAGDVYILLIDNFSVSTQPFDLDWSLTNGASLDCTPLPVELINFSGESIFNGNQLTWSTLSEINNNYFAIERSEDGYNFEKIGSVNGFGNSNSLLDYSFIDNNVQSDYYYRLKQVDYNGEYEFSNSIFISNNNENEFNLFPNPSNGILSLNIGSSTTSQPVIIQYVNVVGKIIEEQVPISEGTNQYKLNKFQNLKNGIYFVKILDQLGNTIKIDKVVKQ